jgi:hypothetical protein
VLKERRTGGAEGDRGSVALLAQVGKDDGLGSPRRAMADAGEEIRRLNIGEVTMRTDPDLE